MVLDHYDDSIESIISSVRSSAHSTVRTGGMQSITRASQYLILYPAL